MLSLIMLFSFAACGPDSNDGKTPSSVTSSTPSGNNDSSEKNSTPSSAYASYPEKNIEIICASGAGTGFDAIAREIAAIMPKYLPNNITIYVNNLSSGSGAEGWTKAYNADPDGYTLLFYGVPDSLISQALYNRDYDVTEMTPLAGITYEPSVLLASPGSECNDVDDFLALAESGGDIVFGDTGAGGNTHLESLVLSATFGIESRNVHYASTPEVFTGFERNECEFISISLPTSISWIESNSAKALCIMSKERAAELPDVPTIYEMEGVTEEQANLLCNTLQYRRAIWAPPGMDTELRDILIDALEKTVQDEEYLAWAESVSRPVTFVSGDEFNDIIMELFNNHSSFMEIYEAALVG